MSKPKPVRVPSDDCSIVVAGETYYPHEGEWVEVIPTLSVGGFRALRELREAGTRMLAAAGEPDEDEQQLTIADDAFTTLCAALAPRIVDWSWTDDAGRPLPKPDGRPEFLVVLRPEELGWLLGAVKGQTPTQEKKGSRRSRITSLASA